MEFMNTLSGLATSAMLVVSSDRVVDAVVFALYVVIATMILTVAIQVVRNVAYRRRQKKAFDKWKVEYDARMKRQREERIREAQRWQGKLPQQRVR